MLASVARCHLLAEVLAADGMMADAEREILEAEMERQGLGEGERDQVRHFEGAAEALATAAALPESERQALVDALVEAALVDGKLTPSETAAVKRIAGALRLGT